MRVRLRTPVIQVAGIVDQAEADLLVDAGVTHLGIPLRLPDGREDLDEAAAASIVEHLSGRAVTVLITYLDRARDIVELCGELGFDAVQLHGPITMDEIARLRRLDPGLIILRALVVRSDNESALLSRVSACEALVDAFITDTFDPETGRRGATGKVHDWSVSARLVAATGRPVILAGGLNPDNVADAIEAVRPAGVDAHTGLEGPDGRKDPDLVRRFLDEAKAAFVRFPDTISS